MSSNYLNAFVNLLVNFLEDLSLTFPELTDIRVSKNSIEMLRSINPRKILDGFMFYVAPYYKEIFNRNEDFFINIENIQKDNHFQDLPDADQKQNITKMLQLKGLWTQLSENSKTKIWKYFQALLKIGAQGSSFQEHKQITEYINSLKKKVN